MTPPFPFAMFMPMKPIIAPFGLPAAVFIASDCAAVSVAAAMPGSRRIAVFCAFLMSSVSSSVSDTDDSATLTIFSPRAAPHFSDSVEFIASSSSMVCAIS